MSDFVEIESSEDETPTKQNEPNAAISSASSSPKHSSDMPQYEKQESSDAASIYLRNRRYRGLSQLLDKNSKFLANFNPETSRREKRKLSRKTSHNAAKQLAPYNEKGILRESGRNMCDCLDLSCPGCHFPCQFCSSERCGVHCRVMRKWMYEQIEHDAKDLIIRNKLLMRKKPEK